MTSTSCAGEHTQNTTKTGVNKPTRSRKKKTKSDYNGWFSGPYNPVRGETALWIAVITQAMMDALSRLDNAEARYHKHEAIRWLTGNSPDFIEVCLNAGFDPAFIRKRAKRALISPMPWRAAPGKGVRYQERKAYRERTRTPVVAVIAMQASLQDCPQ